jgi:hypothetical protein
VIRHLAWGAACALVASVGLSASAFAAAAPPTVTGPVTGGNGVPVLYSHTSFDLASVGYQRSEYFLEGTANAYSPTTPLTTDGRWTVQPSSQEAYKTRVVVNRPVDDRDFNGTVVVEWLNVTGGVDASPDWTHLHTELIRRGYAWVGVSAQAVGVNALKVAPLGDPVRYATLTHPGDSYSYDIFSQAGQAIRDDAELLLDGLAPRRLLAVGESQSAARLATYIDAVHPLGGVYDGFLVHSLITAASPLSQAPLPAVPAPVPTFIRDDLDVPVLLLQTETDAGGLLARRPDTPVYRLWEVAGTAHFDLYGLRQGATDAGGRQPVADWFDSMLHPTNQPSPTHLCTLPVNTGPQTFVLRAAISALNRWVANGTPPPTAPRLKTISIDPLEYALDANGNVLGGIRTPAVDAAVAKLSGLGNGGTFACSLFGTTVPFSTAQLTALYGDHNGFVAAWTRATLRAVRAGFILPEDAAHILAVGAQSSFMG